MLPLSDNLLRSIDRGRGGGRGGGVGECRACSQLYIRISSSYLLIRGTCLALDPWVMDELHVGPDRIRQGYLRSSYRLAKTDISLSLHSGGSQAQAWIYRVRSALRGFRNKCQALGEICRKRVVARRGEKPSVRRDRGETVREEWL